MGCNCQKPTIEKCIPEYNVVIPRSLCSSDVENQHLKRPVSGLIEMEDLKSALLELLIRFDTNPNYYTREDFKKLLDILSHSLSDKITELKFDLVTEKVNTLQQYTEQLFLLITNIYEVLNGSLHTQEEIKEEDILKLFEHITVKYQVADKDKETMKMAVYRSSVDDVLLEDEQYNQSDDLWVFCWKSTIGKKIYSLNGLVATGERVYSEQEVEAALDYKIGESRVTYLQEHNDGFGEWITIDD